MKKMILSAVTLSCVLMFAGSSIAANTWDTCGIQRLGVSGTSANLFKVTSCGTSGNNDKWLSLVNQKDTSMAVLLTAISLGKEVKLNADFATATTTGSAYGAVEVIYLDN